MVRLPLTGSKFAPQLMLLRLRLLSSITSGAPTRVYLPQRSCTHRWRRCVVMCLVRRILVLVLVLVLVLGAANHHAVWVGAASFELSSHGALCMHT